MPPRTTRKSYRPRASDRTMVGNLRPHCLFASETERRRHANEMNLRKRENHGNSIQHKGWMARRIPPLAPVVGELFFLTSPFIERGNRTSLTMAASGDKRTPELTNVGASNDDLEHPQAA